MNKKFIKRLEAEILTCKQHLQELSPHIESNPSAAVAYNRTLVKKAILVDKYKKMRHPEPIFAKIGKLLKFKKSKKLICDYFPNS